MKQTVLILMIFGIATSLLACTTAPAAPVISSPAPTVAPTLIPPPTATIQVSSSDPFAYCQAVGTIDSPDARYTGERVPVSVARALQKAMGLAPDVPLDFLIRGTFWRCMNGKVYACTVGANIPCESKANTGKTANAGMIEWCSTHPNDQGIPAAASGRETVYTWRCSNTVPEIITQVFNPDARGFIAEFWYMLSAN